MYRPGNVVIMGSHWMKMSMHLDEISLIIYKYNMDTHSVNINNLQLLLIDIYVH